MGRGSDLERAGGTRLPGKAPPKRLQNSAKAPPKSPQSAAVVLAKEREAPPWRRKSGFSLRP